MNYRSLIILNIGDKMNLKKIAFAATVMGATLLNAADNPMYWSYGVMTLVGFNVSTYNMGMMGYKTPNIDRIAKEGATFTDWYGQQSCTAGRAAFITGESPIRTGLLKVGLPGAKGGMPMEAPTIAGLLKNQGYATGQFGKNHLGDLDTYVTNQTMVLMSFLETYIT